MTAVEAAPAHFECLDAMDVCIDQYQRSANILRLSGAGKVSRKCCSHLLKSNCPVTGQPDWASVFIAYEGEEIEPASLLKYLISYREQQDFHEHCVETLFTDILNICQPDKLTVYARYTRRGGLDINPFRSNFEPVYGNWRVVRQ
jgi:7-cyano-7-deazaguanine reductase